MDDPIPNDEMSSERQRKVLDAYREWSRLFPERVDNDPLDRIQNEVARIMARPIDLAIMGLTEEDLS